MEELGIILKCLAASGYVLSEVIRGCNMLFVWGIPGGNLFNKNIHKRRRGLVLSTKIFRLDALLPEYSNPMIHKRRG